MSSDRPRLPALLSGLLASAACSDPSVTVGFVIPEHYRLQVTEVSLQILVPPVAEPFNCDDLAFQNVPEIAVVASRSQEVRTRTRRSLDIRGIPRLGQKLFFVRGLDRDGVAIVAACREIGDIEEDVEVTLVGEPVAVVSAPALAPGNPLPQRVRVEVSDTAGEPLPDVDVRWVMTAPGGAPLSGNERTAPDGHADLYPPSGLLPGPVALDVAARWQRSQAASIIGFTEAPIMFQDSLPGEQPEVSVGRTEAIYQVGAIGPNGEPGIAGLGPTRVVADGRQVYIAYRPAGPSGTPFHVTASAPLLNVHALGLAAADGRDRVVAINGFQLVDIDPVDGSTTATLLTPTPGAAAARILPVGPCGGTLPGNSVLLVAFADESVAAYDANGQQVAGNPFATNPPTPRPIASGCVDDIGKEAHRTVVFAGEGFQHYLMGRTDEGAVHVGPWATYAAGVGFLPAIAASSPRLLLGPSVSIEGTAIARYQLIALEDNELDLELQTQDDSATLFWSAQGGDVDGDGRADVVALLDFGVTAEGLTEFRLLVALGLEHRGQRVVGISGPATAPSPRLFLTDFNRDGYDDILVATPVSATIFQMGPVGSH